MKEVNDHKAEVLKAMNDILIPDLVYIIFEYYVNQCQEELGGMKCITKYMDDKRSKYISCCPNVSIEPFLSIISL